jgi:hypothetical protein
MRITADGKGYVCTPGRTGGRLWTQAEKEAQHVKRFLRRINRAQLPSAVPFVQGAPLGFQRCVRTSEGDR